MFTFFLNYGRFFLHFLKLNWKKRALQFKVCCDILSDDYISALNKVADVKSEMMFPKLTRIDAMTLEIVTTGKLLHGFTGKYCRCGNSQVSLLQLL